jgi:hypothetical protein
MVLKLGMKFFGENTLKRRRYGSNKKSEFGDGSGMRSRKRFDVINLDFGHV